MTRPSHREVRQRDGRGQPRVSLLLLLLCAVYLLGLPQGEAAPSPSMSVVVCDGDGPVTLSCPYHSQVQILDANFGRTVSYGKLCDPYTRGVHVTDMDVNCIDPYSVSYVSDRCNGTQNCELEYNSDPADEHCVGTYKYLEVAFKCRPQEWLNTNCRTSYDCPAWVYGVCDNTVSRCVCPPYFYYSVYERTCLYACTVGALQPAFTEYRNVRLDLPSPCGVKRKARKAKTPEECRATCLNYTGCLAYSMRRTRKRIKCVVHRLSVLDMPRNFQLNATGWSFFQRHCL